MFAVKGWSVDASKLRRETVNDNALGLGTEKQNRKRKRNGTVVPPNEDVGELWGQHIEGKKLVTAKNEAKGPRKRQHMKQEPEVGEAGRDHGISTKTNGKSMEDTQNIVDVAMKSDSSRRKKKMKKKMEGMSDKRFEKDMATNSNTLLTSASKAAVPSKSASTTPPPAPNELTPMQAAMRQKLISARFRHLNQTLYTEPSAKALELFDQNPELFEDYHSGFRRQVSVWPENPIDSFIATIRQRGSVSLPSQKKMFKNKKQFHGGEENFAAADRKLAPLPRTHGTCVIADLGCGDARLAQTLRDSNEGQKLQVKISSYDLYSPSPLVVKADISNIPSADGSVDIAILCLALMGTNWISFIEEAYRILHWKGELWIAEIKSRFGRAGRAGKPVEHSVGGKRKQEALRKAREAKEREREDINEQEVLQVEVDEVPSANPETDVSSFVEVLKRRGFVLKDDEKSIDLGNKMFVRMEFLKASAPTKGKGIADSVAQPLAKFKSKAKFVEDDANEVATDDEAKVLKPCLYKIR